MSFGDDSIGSGGGSGSGDGGGGGGGDAGSGAGAGSGASPGDDSVSSGGGGPDDIKATDWEACGIANFSIGDGAAGGVSMWQFRSATANVKGTYTFTGAGMGMGFDAGGGTAPSPGDVARNSQPAPFTSIKASNPFSANDLDGTSGRITSLSVSPTYGYSWVYISAGMFPELFSSQNVSGWGVGVQVGGSVLLGVWKKVGSSSSYP